VKEWWPAYEAGLDPKSLGVQQSPKGTWHSMHGDAKANAEGKFRASSLVPKEGDSIMLRLDFQGSPVVQTTLKQVPLSMQYNQAIEAAKQYKGRKLNENEKAGKRELDEIMERESRVQERQQTLEVIEARVEVPKESLAWLTSCRSFWGRNDSRI
jgi:hypothetical protein